MKVVFIIATIAALCVYTQQISAMKKFDPHNKVYKSKNLINTNNIIWKQQKRSAAEQNKEAYWRKDKKENLVLDPTNREFESVALVMLLQSIKNVN